MAWKEVGKKALLRCCGYLVEKAGKSGWLAIVGDLYSKYAESWSTYTVHFLHQENWRVCIIQDMKQGQN